jgi:MATE family multidrug resistance protein
MFSIVLHYVWLTLFTVTYELGIKGIGISVAITNGVSFISLFVYSCYIPELQDCMIWPDKRSLYGLWDYIKIAIPMTIMMCTDWYVFELMVFTAGLFGVINQAAQMVLMNIAIILYVSASGLSFVVPSIIG